MSTEIFEERSVPADFKRFDIPLKWGLIIGLLSCALFTIQNMYMMNSMWGYYAGVIISMIVILVLLCMVGFKQRKAMGGYISLKDAFQAIFVAILIILLINTIYSQVYLHFIDPDFTVRMKDMMLTSYEKMGIPQDKLDEMARKIDEQMNQKNSIGTIFFGFVWSIVLYSFFGFICALIVRKNKPQFGA